MQLSAINFAELNYWHSSNRNDSIYREKNSRLRVKSATVSNNHRFDVRAADVRCNLSKLPFTSLVTNFNLPLRKIIKPPSPLRSCDSMRLKQATGKKTVSQWREYRA